MKSIERMNINKRIATTALILMMVVLACFGIVGSLAMSDNMTPNSDSGIVASKIDNVDRIAEVVDGDPVEVTMSNVIVTGRVYDGTVVIDVENVDVGTFSGIVDADVDNAKLNVVSATLASKNATPNDGTSNVSVKAEVKAKEGKTLTNSYVVAEYVATTIIAKAPLTVSGLVPIDKIYDASEKINLTTGTLTGGNVEEDDVSLTTGTCTAIVDDKNVEVNDEGMPKSKNIRRTPLLVGDDKDNYYIDYTDEQKNQEVTISPKEIDVTGMKASNRVYDGTTTVRLDESSPIIAEGGDRGCCNQEDWDNLRLSSYQEKLSAIESASIGNEKIVTVNAKFMGKAALNYTPAFNEVTVNIMPKPLSVKDIKAATRAYNGGMSVDLSGGTLDGVIAGEESNVTFNIVSGKGVIASPNANDKAEVTYDIALTGEKSGNYIVNNESGKGYVYAKITRADIHATWSAVTFVYDGARHLPTIDLSGLFSADEGKVTAVAKYDNESDSDLHGINYRNGGYDAYIKLEGDNSVNYNVIEATNKINITRIEVQVQWSDTLEFVYDNSPKTVTATVTNPITVGGKPDGVGLLISGNSNTREGAYTAEIIGVRSLDNPDNLSDYNYSAYINYCLPAVRMTKDYSILASMLTNSAVTPYKLNMQIISANGFQPNTKLLVEYLETSKAVYEGKNMESQVYHSYKVSTSVNNEVSSIKGEYTYKILLGDNWKKVKTIKAIVYNGESVEEIDMTVEGEYASFKANNVQEFTIVLVQSPIFIWLWIILGIIAAILVIIMIWLFIYRATNRKLLFDPSGGEPVEGIEGKYRAEITMPSTKRENYEFEGWYKHKNYKDKAGYSFLPFWDTITYAKWTDADGVPVPYEKGSTILEAGKVVETAPALANTIDEQNSKKFRQITLDTRGGYPLAPINALKESSITLPVATKTNDAFAGWFFDEECTSPAIIGTMPKKSVTIFAKWASDRVNTDPKAAVISVDKSSKTRTVTFDTRGGNIMQELFGVKKAVIEVKNPTKANDTFAGWYSDKALTKKLDLTTMPTEDITAYAKWSSDLNGVGVATSLEMKRNLAINDDFAKKATDATPHDRLVGVPKEVESKIDQLLFGTQVMPSSRPLVDEARRNAAARPTIPTAPPVATAPRQENVVPRVQTIIEPIKLADEPSAREDKAVIQEKLTVKSILFNVRGGNPIKPMQAKIGTPIDLPVPIKGESQFRGWYKDEGLTKPCDFNKMPSKNIMLFAKWIEDGTVQDVFDSGLINDAEVNASKKDLEDQRKTIDKMFKKNDGGLDDMVILRNTDNKKSMLVDESKRK